MAADDFEIVVCSAGRPAGANKAVTAACAARSGLRLRTVQGGATRDGQAVNLAVASAHGRYITFVDECDTVSAEYLDVLVRHSGPQRIGLALVAEAGPGVGVSFRADATRHQLERSGAVVPTADLPEAALHAEGALIPIGLARAVTFRAGPRDGGGLLFWSELVDTATLEFGLPRPSEHAVYYRGAGTRPVAAEDVCISDRLDAIVRLNRLVGVDARLIRAAANEQADALNQILRRHPHRHAEVLEQVRRRGLSGVDFGRLNRGLARDLAILYVAPPYVDTSALVAARRVREAAVLTDVLASDMSLTRATDPSSHVVWEQFVDSLVETKTRPTADYWPDLLPFCRQGLARIEELEAAKGPYRHVYSRAMLTGSHLLAALYKARHPSTPWTAEFSDPMLHDADGSCRTSSGRPDPQLLADLGRILVDHGVQPPADDNVWVWVELLAYAAADEIVFTNSHQRDYMLGYCADRAVAERARNRSVIAPHPIPAPELYRAVTAEYPLDPQVVNVAYFGVFYSTRGLTEVADALNRLDPDVRARVRLHVFTRRPEELAEQLRTGGLGDVIVANPYVGYLQFLNLTTQFDALLVNDYRTLDTHPMNPYLPAKYSDYAGSGTPIWGMVEPGSVLSELPIAHRSLLGDVQGAVEVLNDLVVRKFGERAKRAHRQVAAGPA